MPRRRRRLVCFAKAKEAKELSAALQRMDPAFGPDTFVRAIELAGKKQAYVCDGEFNESQERALKQLLKGAKPVVDVGKLGTADRLKNAKKEADVEQIQRPRRRSI